MGLIQEIINLEIRLQNKFRPNKNKELQHRPTVQKLEPMCLRRREDLLDPKREPTPRHI